MEPDALYQYTHGLSDEQMAELASKPVELGGSPWNAYDALYNEEGALYGPVMGNWASPTTLRLVDPDRGDWMANLTPEQARQETYSYIPSTGINADTAEGQRLLEALDEWNKGLYEAGRYNEILMPSWSRAAWETQNQGVPFYEGGVSNVDTNTVFPERYITGLETFQEPVIWDLMQGNYGAVPGFMGSNVMGYETNIYENTANLPWAFDPTWKAWWMQPINAQTGMGAQTGFGGSPVPTTYYQSSKYQQAALQNPEEYYVPPVKPPVEDWMNSFNNPYLANI